MIFFKFSKKNIMTVSCIFVFFITVCITNTIQGMQHYQKVDFQTGIVTATTLNVREGPGTGYKVVKQIYKNEYIRVFAQIGEWYVVQVEGDFVGVVSKKYIKPVYPQTGNGGESDSNNSGNSINLNFDEKEVFNLINKKRVEAGISPLKIDNETQKVARIKAKDMVDNDYFSHNSPTYGSPFDMLKKFKISYKAAGENIAGNSSNTKAVEAWMNSEGHRANILNNSFNYTGIGAVESKKYGKMYVQLFIGR